MLAHGLEEYNDPKVGTRGQQVQQTEHELFELYKNPDLDHKPEQLANVEEHIIQMQLVKQLLLFMEINYPHIVVTTKNNGSVPDLPADLCGRSFILYWFNRSKSYCLWVITTSSKRMVTMHEKHGIMC